MAGLVFDIYYGDDWRNQTPGYGRRSVNDTEGTPYFQPDYDFGPGQDICYEFFEKEHGFNVSTRESIRRSGNSFSSSSKHPRHESETESDDNGDVIPSSPKRPRLRGESEIFQI